MNTGRQKCYSYVRFSSDVQAFGQSLRRQTEKTREFAQKHNLELVEDYQDLGVSAFHGRNVTHGALGRFITAVREGKVPKGSYLRIESLDRISRQAINLSLSILLEILNSGIHIATDKRIYKAGETSLGDVIEMVVELSRSFDEGFFKSTRSKDNWARKRAKGTPITSRCPAWLKPITTKDASGRVVDINFKPMADRVRTLRMMFDLAAKGMGVLKISKHLNDKKKSVWGRSEEWTASYVAMTLRNRAVMGEHQHCTVVSRDQTPIGDPDPTYYPRIIEPGLFHNVQDKMNGRIHHGRGRKGTYFTNLFSGFATCAYCGSTMYYKDKGKGRSVLVCGAATQGAGCGVTTYWKYDDFEASFLRFVEQLDLPALINDTSTATEELDNEIAELEDALRQLQKDIAKAYAVLEIEQLDVAVTELKKKEAKRPHIQKQLDEKKGQRQALVASDQAFYESKGEIVELIHRLQSRKGADAKILYKLRARVSAQIRSLCKEIHVAVVGDKSRVEKLEDGTVLTSNDDRRYLHVVFSDGLQLREYPNRDKPLQSDSRATFDVPDGTRFLTTRKGNKVKMQLLFR